MRKLLLSLIATTAIVGAAFVMSTSANAAAGAPSGLLPAVTDTSMVEDVQWRRCWHRWRTSRVFCRYWGHRWGWSRGGHRWGWSRR